MNEFFTPDMLKTFAGSVAAVTALTQVLKTYIPQKLDPKWLALVLSIIITFGVQFVFDGATSENWIMSAFNALAITGASIGAYEGFVKPVVSKEG